MFCNQCGTDNKDEARFCRNCAAPLVPLPPPPQPSTSYGAPQEYTPVQPPPVAGNYPMSSPVQPDNQAGGGYQQYQGYQSSYAGYNQAPAASGSASGRAITAMILSLISIGTCGPFLSVPGMILGRSEMKAIAEGRSAKAGEIFAKIGFWAGLALTVLYALLIVFYVVVIGIAVSTGSID